MQSQSLLKVRVDALLGDLTTIADNVTLTYSTVHLEVRVLILSCFCLTAAHKALYTQQHAANTANVCYKLNVMVCP